MCPTKFKRVMVVLAGVSLLAIPQVTCGDKDTKVRPNYFAGSWYPGDANALKTEIDGLLGETSPPKLTSKPLAVIAPHAGYRFSAPVAAAGYNCLKGQSYKRVIVLAFSHRYAGSYNGIDIPSEWNAYRTPLGNIPIDQKVIEQLAKQPEFAPHSGVDRNEHSLELQLPFLQRTLGSFRLVPLLVGRMSPGDYVSAAKVLNEIIDADTLVVASTDFTHFGPNYGYEPFKDDVPKKLSELADKAAAAIETCDVDDFAAHLRDTNDTICGCGPVMLLLRTLSMHGRVKAMRAAYDTSGQMTDDWTNSVTYQSFVFVRRPLSLSKQEQDILLKLARQTVTAVLNNKELPKPNPNELTALLRQDGACFVTLNNHGELRGCIGNMEARGPLYEAVTQNAVSAATRDYRFAANPITPAELDKINIEISYLTPMKQVKDTGKIHIGQHGLMISLGGRRGVLLPQVAYERGWAREEFLAHLCHKAGLPMDAWKRLEAQLYSFEAEVFGEPEPPTATAPAK